MQGAECGTIRSFWLVFFAVIFRLVAFAFRRCGCLPARRQLLRVEIGVKLFVNYPVFSRFRCLRSSVTFNATRAMHCDLRGTETAFMVFTHRRRSSSSRCMRSCSAARAACALLALAESFPSALLRSAMRGCDNYRLHCRPASLRGAADPVRCRGAM